ncbi:MAG: endo-1,4-beta-xylanase [Planctomycetota bacterium]
MSLRMFLTTWLAVALLPVSAQAQVILGDEFGEPGWGYWDAGFQSGFMPPEAVVSTEQATSGISSVKITNVANDNTLAYAAGPSNGDRLQEFLNNTHLEFDVIFFKDTSTSGFHNVRQVNFNFGNGFQGLANPTPVATKGYGSGGEAVTVENVRLEYATLPGWDSSVTPDFLQVIWSTQNQVAGTNNEAIYIDNVRLTGAAPDPFAHRKSALTVRVEDSLGNPLPNANIDVQMTRHDFRFGTQIRDRFVSISQSEFNSLTTTQKQNLLPDQTNFGAASRYIPTYQDVENYREAILEHFNYVVPTVGMQWLAFNNAGPSTPDATINWAQSNGLSVAAASVVWQRDQWPTPVQFRSENNPNPATFHSELIDDRLGPGGIMARYSDTGPGPTISEWKLLNEPLNETYFADTFVNAGIYADNIAAMADYFIRADAQRPDARLMINEFNILNWSNNSEATQYRDLINDLLAAGAPIDVIGVQAHMSRNDVTKADIIARLDILAETGLPIEITEFDSRDDSQTSNPLTPAEQEQIFRDVLEAAFEHESVEGFDMWGFWDPGHWRYNGPLFENDWTVKSEAAPWFDLVRGDWMPSLSGQSLSASGQWVARWMGHQGLFNGTYDFAVNLDGETTLFEGIEVSEDGQLVLVVDTGVPGDFDGDLDVDGADFLAWQRDDATAEGLAAWQAAYLANGLEAASSVPEPGAAVMLLVNLGIMAIRDRRSRQYSDS